MIAEALHSVISAATGGWMNKPASSDYWYGPRGTSVAGVNVDEDTAMTFTTFYACVNKLSKTVATLPVHTYERTGPDTREPVQHELEELLNGQANEDSLGLTVREAMMANVLVWGRGYWEIVYANGGRRVSELYHLDARRVRPMVGEDGKRYYEYRPEGAAVPDVLPASRVLHIPGLSLNGTDGLSVVGYNRLAIALGLAATKFGAAFFGNGAWAGGFVKRSRDADKTNPLTREKAEEFLHSLNEKFRGPDKAFGFGLLREDMEFQQLEMPFEDAMFLGTRRFTREDICGLLDVPPSKIHDHSHSTFSNVEHLDIAWAKDSILPWCVRMESAWKAKFFRGSSLYAKHNLAGLMRGDLASRMEAYAKGILNGIWSINDVRQMEDMNPIPGGDEHYRPLNVGRVGDSFEVPTTGGAGADGAGIMDMLARMLGSQSGAVPDADGHRERLIARALPGPDAEAWRPMLVDASKRVVGKEVKAVANAYKRRAKEDTADGF